MIFHSAFVSQVGKRSDLIFSEAPLARHFAYRLRLIPKWMNSNIILATPKDLSIPRKPLCYNREQISWKLGGKNPTNSQLLCWLRLRIGVIRCSIPPSIAVARLDEPSRDLPAE